jgi:hypothetical protein
MGCEAFYQKVLSGHGYNYVDPTGLTFADGAISYFRGIMRSADYTARRSGARGKCEQQKAEKEGQLLAEAIATLKSDPELAKNLAKQAWNRADGSTIAGRAATGMAVTKGLSTVAGSYGAALGMSLAATAINGDVREAASQGNSLLEIVQAGMEGANGDDSSSNCDCSR